METDYLLTVPLPAPRRGSRVSAHATEDAARLALACDGAGHGLLTRRTVTYDVIGTIRMDAMPGPVSFPVPPAMVTP